MEKDNMHFTVIGDFIGSQKLTNRYDVQEELRKILNRINRKYKSDITSNFSIGKGDEFQGNLNKIDNIVLIIHEIMSEFLDFDIRFGIGYGSIDTKYFKTNAYGSDGESWYFARKAIDEVKDHNEKNPQYHYANYRFCFREQSDIDTDFYNGMINNNFLIYKDWTKKQRGVANYLFKQHGFNDDFIQKEVAKKIETSSQNLNKTLKSMNYYYYITFLNLINDKLKGELS